MKKILIILPLCLCLTLSACCCPVWPKGEASDETASDQAQAQPEDIVTEPPTEPSTEPPAPTELVVSYYEPYKDQFGIEYKWVEPYPLPVVSLEKGIYDRPEGKMLCTFSAIGYYNIVEQAEDTRGNTWGRLSDGQGWTMIYQQVLPDLDMVLYDSYNNSSTRISITGTGFFRGNYHHTYTSDYGYGAPSVTIYVSDFEGKLNVTDVGEYTVTLKLAKLTTDYEPYETWTENGMTYYSTPPYGLTDCTYFTLYLPHTPVNWVPDEVLSQSSHRYSTTLDCYALYNPNTGDAFFS